MTSYSSDDFYQDWRYAIERDFQTTSGKPYNYAIGGLCKWRSTIADFPHSIDSYGVYPIAVSGDGKYLATADQCDIKIFDLSDTSWLHHLKGHSSRVVALAFQPGNSECLLSQSDVPLDDGVIATNCEIIVWNLENYNSDQLVRKTVVERLSRNASNEIIADATAISSDTKFRPDDQKTLASLLETTISKFMLAKIVEGTPKMVGRLLSSFGSMTFSPSGKLFFWKPGNGGARSKEQELDVHLFSVKERKDILILTGHRDKVVWGGFNHDETLVGTACWDGGFRIFNMKDGSQKHLWNTGKQNWTGSFSPDSKYFAGTSGDNKLHVYDLSDGSEHWTFSAEGKGWYRALAWHPRSDCIALGGGHCGRLYLVNLHERKVIQERILSLKEMKVPEETRRKSHLGAFLSVTQVKFVDGGRKLVCFTRGDGSAEVYDLEKQVKWRFARTGTMKPAKPTEIDNEVTSKGGSGMSVYEDPVFEEVMVFTADPDTTRLWTVPLTTASPT